DAGVSAVDGLSRHPDRDADRDVVLPLDPVRRRPRFLVEQLSALPAQSHVPEPAAEVHSPGGHGDGDQPARELPLRLLPRAGHAPLQDHAPQPRHGAVLDELSDPDDELAADPRHQGPRELQLDDPPARRKPGGGLPLQPILGRPDAHPYLPAVHGGADLPVPRSARRPLAGGRQRSRPPATAYVLARAAAAPPDLRPPGPPHRRPRRPPPARPHTAPTPSRRHPQPPAGLQQAPAARAPVASRVPAVLRVREAPHGPRSPPRVPAAAQRPAGLL